MRFSDKNYTFSAAQVFVLLILFPNGRYLSKRKAKNSIEMARSFIVQKEKKN